MMKILYEKNVLTKNTTTIGGLVGTSETFRLSNQLFFINHCSNLSRAAMFMQRVYECANIYEREYIYIVYMYFICSFPLCEGANDIVYVENETVKEKAVNDQRACSF